MIVYSAPRRFAAVLAGSVALATCVGCASQSPTLRVATTTSVDNSGLLDTIVPAYEHAHGVNLHVIAVGSGQAFQLGRRGDVAVLLTHEPSGERALFRDGLIRYYRKVMFNHFLVAGPAGDPAGAAGAVSASEAMARIARSGHRFASRGDESGTHVREKHLWKTAGAAPMPVNMIETGQGMASTLRMASERQAYVLTDEATFARLAAAVNLRVIFKGDHALLNTYAVILLTTVSQESLPRAAHFARWMVEGPGRAHIEAFRIGGRQVFFTWPPAVDAASPESVPLKGIVQ